MFLGLCVTLRAYALSLSFDPVLSQNLRDAMRLESAFGRYFLVPILLAAGILLLEAGLVSRRRGVQAVALSVPLLCLYLSWPRSEWSVPYGEFLERFTSTVGAPFWIATVAAVAYFAYAWLRDVRTAEVWCLASMTLTACVDRHATGIPLTLDFSAKWLWLLALAATASGLMRHGSRRCFLAALAAVVAFRATWLPQASWMWRDLLPVNVMVATMLSYWVHFSVTGLPNYSGRQVPGCCCAVP